MSPSRGLLPLLFLLLAGCLPPPQPVDSIGDPATARALLVARAAEGSVPMVLRGELEALPARRIAETAARAVRAVEVRFAAVTAIPAEGSYLLLVLHGGREPLPRRLCREADRLPVDVAERVAAAWCEGERTVAAVDPAIAEPTAAAVERAIRRAMAALFPDDYADIYGFELFGMRITIGGSFGF